YAVDVGVREGDAHQGYSGRQYGIVSPDLVFFTGRQVFLIPRSREPIERVSVGVVAPPGREVFTPWRWSGDTWHPGVRGIHAMDDLLAGTVGIGRFHVPPASIGRTRIDYAFPASPPADIEEKAFGALSAAARYVSERFGRDLGPTYRTLVLDKTAEGDELVGDGWATGQGRTLL